MWQQRFSESVAGAADERLSVHMALLYSRATAMPLRRWASQCEQHWQRHAVQASDSIRRWIARSAGLCTGVCVLGSHVAFPLPRSLRTWTPAEQALAGGCGVGGCGGRAAAFAINLWGGSWEVSLSAEVARWALEHVRGQAHGVSPDRYVARRNRLGKWLLTAVPLLQRLGVETGACCRMVAAALRVLGLPSSTALLMSGSMETEDGEVVAICLQAGIKLEWCAGPGGGGGNRLAVVLERVREWCGVSVVAGSVSAMKIADIMLLTSWADVSSQDDGDHR